MSCCPNGIFAPLIRDCNGNIRPLMSSEQLLVGGTYLSDMNWANPGGRLSNDSNEPVVQANTNNDIYYLPFKGNKIAVFNNVFWFLASMGDGLSAVAPNTTGDLYDVFVKWDEITDQLALVFSDPWTDPTTRSEGIEYLHGVLVRSSNPRERYVGTIKTDDSSAGQVQDDLEARNLYNHYNQVQRALTVTDPGTLEVVVGGIEATYNHAHVLFTGSTPTVDNFSLGHNTVATGGSTLQALITQ